MNNVLVSSWVELSKIQASETHYLDIEEFCGWVRRVGSDETETYLSTHTFYGKEHERSTALLRGFGFDVTIDNWDKKND